MHTLIQFTTNEGFVFSLPEGKILYQQRSLERAGSYEPEISAIIKQVVNPGMKVIECGSCCGYHTLTLARAVGPTGKVYCFEANPELIPILRYNLEANGYHESIEIINKGVWDKEDVLYFPILHAGLGRASITALQKRLELDPSWSPLLLEQRSKQIKKIISLEVVSIDHLFKDKDIDILRMDIEGAELKALQGAQQLLSQRNVTIITEWTLEQGRTDEETLEFFEFLKSFGYKIYRILTYSLPEVETAADLMSSLRNPEDIRCRDILCTKNELSYSSSLARLR